MPFDIDALEATGTPVPVQSNVMGLRNSGVVFASLAANGILAYVAGEPEDLQREMHWRYLDGTSEVISEIPVGSTLHMQLSPDGKKIVTSTAGAATYDIWVHDLERKNRTRLTFEGDNGQPHWSPDGKFIYYTSTRDGRGRVFKKAADGTGDEELIWDVDGVTVGTQDISADGRILVMSYHGENKADLYTLALDAPSAEPQPLLNGPHEEDLARFSPDGRWLAYTTDEPGGFEVFVCPASGIGGRWQISSDGGVLPRWSRDGKQLFYRLGRQLFGFRGQHLI